MSEADAGARDESPSRTAEEPAAAMRIKEERRSSSVDVVDVGNGELLVLHSIFYQGKTLRLPGNRAHMYPVVFQMIKGVCSLVKQLVVAFPKGWDQNTPSISEIAALTKSFNRVAKPFASNWSGSYNTDTLKEWGEPNCSAEVAKAITTYAYECAVPRPADLNQHYKSFTSETYGETNPEQLISIIDELNIGPQDVFVDLGSGIGQLVCLTAAYAKCKKSVGIELSQVPSNFAQDLAGYFKKFMSHFGKNHGKFEHIQGDFLNPKFKQLICEEATVIFINNFAFDAALMLRINTELLQDLKHGTRIVTTKELGTNKKEITFRSTSDINAISHTTELKTTESAVSWTSSHVKFWLTTIDHTKLIKYYEDQRRRQEVKSSREGSEISDGRDMGLKKRKSQRESSVHPDKLQKTEQAAASSHQSPKWNEPDTDYTPPAKKPKKEKLLREQQDATPASSHHHGASSSSGKDREKEKEKKKNKIYEEKKVKTPKPPKSSSSRYSSETPTSHHHHHRSNSISHSSDVIRPSQPKATAPPPPLVPAPARATASTPPPAPPAARAQSPKREEPLEPPTDLIHHGGGQLDAKTMNALHTIREAATTSAQAAAIQDAINSVLSQPTEASPSAFGPPLAHLPAPVAIYPTPPPPPAPAPAAPQQASAAPAAPNVMPVCTEIAAEQRHTFMIPPTDPFYNMIVSYYFAMKQFCNQSKTADPEFVGRLRLDIEAEEARRAELKESITLTSTQIDELLATGVNTLKSRLDELGMPSVTDVTELLAGSKQIVTQHKGLTNTVAQMENSVAVEEQKLRLIGGPDAVRYFDEAMSHPNVDIAKLTDLVITTRPPNFVAQILLPDDSPTASIDSKVSPSSSSSRRPRQPKPRANNTAAGAGGGGKRGTSGGRKSDGGGGGGATEDVELEIRQFVQHALKVDNAVKEKERKARGNFMAAAADRIPR
ncbi:Histone-lysine N-methyltransferase, H3 lysine-79 specific [Caenorhabditis elegans]|uniref:Histone-lysine N-methyltransferase, H3 lysine-79 specific n=2 Tax=Caenorhabditis elegans TaxID=6239 RepID=DOT11_CAEEL|nr:Histone-lysine N-methyltransferase, H3 lysine-79 specific [Caenorhabditis elegans]Q6AW06.2 RecName: Full=Histone-lysine N-methyltransferase, H3 lysine-79 specific; AltName: Full=Histone H3-K79 methyltransferase [Caenorhabditis elegans]CCD69916.1 Histone-lysine N-methyltransferase, H3 lysine-79 specific [Caenorhabditis elegans]|eukprot:NP_740808.2 Histone-lysine N-methyltransferase, H3 lysine-79 specific [Caenorhabditis elegans]